MQSTCSWTKHCSIRGLIVSQLSPDSKCFSYYFLDAPNVFFSSFLFIHHTLKIVYNNLKSAHNAPHEELGADFHPEQRRHLLLLNWRASNAWMQLPLWGHTFLFLSFKHPCGLQACSFKRLPAFKKQFGFHSRQVLSKQSCSGVQSWPSWEGNPLRRQQKTE